MNSSFFSVLIIAATTLQLAFAEPPADPLHRVVYNSSEVTPDAIAFQHFSGQVYDHYKESSDEARSFVTFTLRIPKQEFDRQSRLAVALSNAYESAERDILMSEYTNNCNAEESHKTNEQIFLDMDNQDDLNESIMMSHYSQTLANLDSTDRRLLQEQLVRYKDSLYYAKLNHKTAWEATNPKIDMSKKMNEICGKLASRIEKGEYVILYKSLKQE